MNRSTKETARSPLRLGGTNRTKIRKAFAVTTRMVSGMSG